MGFKRILSGRKLLLLVILLVGALAISGCAPRGAQPKGWSGGTIANGTLFLGSMEGKLVAMDTSDGSRLWEVPFQTSRPSGGFGFGCTPGGSTTVAIYGNPAISGELVYIGGYNGKIYAVNADSGAIKWQYPPEAEDYLKPIVGGAVVALDKVYFGGSDGKVYALDAATGGKKWEFEGEDTIWSTPAIVDDTLFIGSFDKKLYALNAADGSKKWEFETGGAIVSTPVVYNNTIYFGSFDRHLYAVDATSGQQIWQFPESEEAGSQPGNWFWAKSVVYDNTIYAGNLDGKVYILNTETGKERAGPIDLRSPISSSPVLVSKFVIIAIEEGIIYALDTDNNQVRQLADMEEKVYGPLSGGDGVVYIHTEKDGLYAVDVQSGAKREFYIK